VLVVIVALELGVVVSLGVVVVVVIADIVSLLEVFVVLARLVLQVDADIAELSLQKLEQLVDVVAPPLVEHIGQELEEIAAVEATLDLFDLLLRERLEDVLAQRFGITFLNGIRRRETDLLYGTLVEVNLHEDGFV